MERLLAVVQGGGRRFGLKISSRTAAVVLLAEAAQVVGGLAAVQAGAVSAIISIESAVTRVRACGQRAAA